MKGAERRLNVHFVCLLKRVGSNAFLALLQFDKEVLVHAFVCVGSVVPRTQVYLEIQKVR